MVNAGSWDLGARCWGITFALAAGALSATAYGQGTLLTPAVFQSHCAARFSFEASRAKQQSDATSFHLLSKRAMELARERKFGASETDEQLALYAKSFETFLRDKAASNPELEAAFGQAVEQCKASLDNHAD